MNLDDETAARIVREAVEKNEVWSGRYIELVRAGYAYRDAEVEELRAELDILRATEDGNLSAMRERAEKAEATLAKVRELARPGVGKLRYCDRPSLEEEIDAQIVLDEWRHGRTRRAWWRLAGAALAKVREVYDAWFKWESATGNCEANEAVDLLLSDISDALDESPTERETGADEWEYQYIPVTEDGEEWAGRSREECDELIRAHADPSHWVHEPHNDDLHPVVSYRVERRRKAGPWEVVPDDRA